MTAFIEEEIAALNASRRRYFSEMNDIAADVDEISSHAIAM